MSRRLWKTRFCLPTLFSAAVVLIAVSSISVLHNPVTAQVLSLAEVYHVLKELTQP